MDVILLLNYTDFAYGLCRPTMVPECKSLHSKSSTNFYVFIYPFSFSPLLPSSSYFYQLASPRTAVYSTTTLLALHGRSNIQATRPTTTTLSMTTSYEMTPRTCVHQFLVASWQVVQLSSPPHRSASRAWMTRL